MTDAFFQASNDYDSDAKTWDEDTAVSVLEANIRHLVHLRGARETAMQLYRVADLCAAQDATLNGATDEMVAPVRRHGLRSKLTPKLIGLCLFIGSIAASIDLVYDIIMLTHW